MQFLAIRDLGWRAPAVSEWKRQDAAVSSHGCGPTPDHLCCVPNVELTVLDGDGRPDWHRMWRRFLVRSPGSIANAARPDPAVFRGIDVLSVDLSTCGH